MGTTTDRNDPRLTHGIDSEPVEQAEVYLVLTPAERTKGYVRPYRDSYLHVGKPVCRCEHVIGRHIRDAEADRHGNCYGPGTGVEAPDACPCQAFEASGRSDGCGTVTHMAPAIAETYARQPDFYGATYCVGCRRHIPLREFAWEPDGSALGS